MSKVDLLSPILGKKTGTKPPYSEGARFFVAFFGGPVACILFEAENARRLQRFEGDRWLFGIALLGVLAGLFGIALFMIAPDIETFESLKDVLMFRSRNARYVSRGLGILVWAVFYFRYRSDCRAVDFAGVKHPSAWGPGILAVLLGGTIQFFIMGIFMFITVG